MSPPIIPRDELHLLHNTLGTVDHPELGDPDYRLSAWPISSGGMVLTRGRVSI